MLWAAFGLFLFGCTDAELPRVQESADSAGVRIVVNAPPYPIWRLDGSAALRLGAVEGDPDHQFSTVSFAAGLSNGRIVVVDQGSNEARWYGPDGTFLFRAGGPGEGPGELVRVVSGTLLSGDTLALFDARNQRITWYGPEGALVRTRRFQATSAFAVTLSDLEGGRLLVVEDRATYNFGGSEFNYARDSLLVMIPSTAGDVVDTLLALPGREAITWVDYVDGRPAATRQMDLPLGEATLARGVGNAVVVVRGSRAEVSFYSADGTLTRSARRTDVQPAVASPGLRERYVESAVEEAAAHGRPAAMIRAGLEERLALLPEDRTVPVFDQMLVDGALGRTWVREFVPPWSDGESSRWTVYDREGRIEGQVLLPPGLKLMHVSGNQLVGVESDELGIEYVAVYFLD